MIPGSPFDHAAAVPRPLSPRAKPATPVSPHGKASPDLDDDLFALEQVEIDEDSDDNFEYTELPV
jgi:hypothetical protein